MIYFAVLLCAISLLLTIACLAERKKRGTPEWERALTLPFALVGVVIVCDLLWIAITAYFWTRSGEKALLLLLFLLPGWFVQLAYLNLWARYDDKGFTQRTLWGKTRSFRYEEITEIRRGAYLDGRGAPRGYEVVIWCGNAYFTISPSQKHFRELLCLLAKKVPRERWKRLDLRKSDPSNHHIANARRQVILSFLLPVIFAGLIVFEIVRRRLGYISKQDLTLALWLFGSLGLLTLAWAILVLAVLRRPERHSQFLQKLAGRWAGYGGKIEYPKDAVTDPLFPEEDKL